MKIGILTHHFVNNYGAFLQTYCLTQAVKRLRPNDKVEVIDFINLYQKSYNTLGLFKPNIHKDTLRSYAQRVCLFNVFKRATNKHLPLSKRVYSVQKINEMQYDIILIGSDEVWNYVDKKSFHSVKFGVGLTCKHLIAYAPSVGLATDFSDFEKNLAEHLKTFSFLSYRDNNTKNLIDQKVQKEAFPVLDPVFLSPLPDVTSENISLLTQKKYVLFYHFGDTLTQEMIDQIHQKGLLLIGAGEYQKGYDVLKTNITPFEMAYLFKKAEYVLTGTFHGVVLSVVHHTPFSVCPNNITRVQKVQGLLQTLHLCDRLIEKGKYDFQKELLRPLDYSLVNAHILEMKQASLDYLNDAIHQEEK